MNAVPGQNPIVVRYLRGEVSLELAATELARVVREVRQAFERGERRIPSELVAQSVEPYDFTEADHPQLRALWDLVEAKTDTTDECAREYLASAGDSAFDQIVRAIGDDVRAPSARHTSESSGVSRQTRGSSILTILHGGSSRTCNSISRTRSWTRRGPRAPAIRITRSITPTASGTVRGITRRSLASVNCRVSRGVRRANQSRLP